MAWCAISGASAPCPVEIFYAMWICLRHWRAPIKATTSPFAHLQMRIRKREAATASRKTFGNARGVEERAV